MKKPALALFDFDGTVTKKDSFIGFLLFSLGKFKFITGFLLLGPFVFMYLIKIYPNWKMKELALNFFFRGTDINNFKKICQEYGRLEIPKIIRPEAQERIKWHRDKGHDIVIVTATIKYYLEEWCQKQKINLIATEMKVNNGKITGNIEGKICYGEEKIRRVKERYSLDNYGRIYAYGDSRGDLPMLSLAQIKYFNWKKI